MSLKSVSHMILLSVKSKYLSNDGGKCHWKCSIDWCPKLVLFSLFYSGGLSSGRTVKWTLMCHIKSSSLTLIGFSFSSYSQIRVKREDGPEQRRSLCLAALCCALTCSPARQRSVHFNAGKFLLKWALYSNLAAIGWEVEELTAAVTVVLDQRASEWQLEECYMALPCFLQV